MDQETISNLESSINQKADLYTNLNDEVEKILATLDHRDAQT